MPQRLIVYTFQASSGIFEALTIYFFIFFAPMIIQQKGPINYLTHII